MSESEPNEPRTAEPTGGARFGRWKRLLVAILLVAVAAPVGAVVALRHLEHPWVKSLVTRTVRSKLGLELDYATMSVDVLSGRVRGTGIRVAQPRRFAAQERDFVTLASLAADASMKALVSGDVRLSRVALGGLAVTYVADETTDTVSLLFPSNEPASPLSRSLDPLHDLGVIVRSLRVDDVRVRYVEVARGAVASRIDAGSLVLEGALDGSRSTPDLALRLRPGSAAGATLALDRAATPASADGTVEATEAMHARARLALDARLAVKDVARLAFTARVLEQTGLDVPEGATLATDAAIEVAFRPATQTTHLAVRRLSLADSLVTAELEADVEDRAADTLRHATGRLDADVERLPFPVEGIEVAEGVHAHVRFADATLSSRALAGTIDGRVEASRLVVADGGRRAGGESIALVVATDGRLALGDANPPSELRRLHVEARARSLFADDPGEGPETHATLRVSELEATAEGGARDTLDARIASVIATQGTHATVEATRLVARAEGAGLVVALADARPADGSATLSASRLAARDGADAVEVAPLDVELDLHSFLREGTGLFGLGGRADVRTRTAGTARSGSTRARFAGVAPDVHIDFDSGASDGTAPIESLTVQEGAATTLAVRGVDLRIASTNATSLAPPDSRGRIRLEGRIAHLESGTTSLGVPSLALDVSGDGRGYAISSRANVSELSTSGTTIAGTQPFRLEGRVEPARRVADLESHFGTASGEGPRFDAKVHASVDPRSGLLSDRVEVEAANAAAIVGLFLPEGTRADFSRVEVEGDGTLAGVFAAGGRPGSAPELARDLRAARGEQRLRVAFSDAVFAQGDDVVESPRVSTEVRYAREGDGPALVSASAEAETIHAKVGGSRVTLAGFRPEVSARIADLAHPETATVTLDARLDRVDQSFVREYPIADVRLHVVADTTPTGAVLRECTLVDGGSRATLSLTGAYERELDPSAAHELALHGREAVSLEGSFDQDLATLAGTSFARTASGHVTVPFTLESGDLASYQVLARVLADRVDLESADGALVVANLDGEVPIDEVVVFLPNEVAISAARGSNPLSRSRFPDIQPFLDRDSFVTADRIAWHGEVLGPLAGNARISGTTLGIDRLEVGYRGGRITGQLVADGRRGAASIGLRGDATGIRSTRDDSVLDANLAIRFLPESLALDGTVQLVRLGKSHLEDLLDALDPFHEDSDMNTVRTALRFGYPRFVRIRAAEGLMDLEVKLGGLAKAVRIDTIRAVPIAPLLEENVAPIVDPLFRGASESVPRVAGREESEAVDEANR